MLAFGPILCVYSWGPLLTCGYLCRVPSAGIRIKHILPNRPGTDIIKFISQLVLSGGDHDGHLFKVLPWEKKFILGAFDVPGPAAISVARGNGKSALVAGIAAAVVDPLGPLHGNRREAVVVASSFEQSRIIYEDVLAFLRQRYDLSDRTLWRVQDSANRATVEYRPTGARLRTIGSDPSKAHGLRPALALLDEPAQWDASRSDRMLAAVRTGLGKTPNSKLIALGTRPADDSHWFAMMLDAGTADYAQCHSTATGDSPFSRSTWRKANPSMDHLPSLEKEIRAEAKLARKDPSMLAAFEALRLNMGISDTVQSTLLDAGTWARIEGDDSEREGRCYWGIDLGTTAAMSAVAAYWPATKRLEVLSAFPNEPDLMERGIRDGVGRLYVEGFNLGELIQTGGEAVDIAELIAVARDRFGAPAAIAADRWREGELRDALKAAQVPLARLESRGMGFKDGAEDVRGFRRACLEGEVMPVESLILASAMAAARVVMDPAGNSKLSKNTQGGRRLNARDDAAAAAILAVALSTRQAAAPRAGGFLGSTATQELQHV